MAVMDADLQDPPSLLPQMLEILQSDEYDSVATRRVSREGEPVIRSWFARRFYKLINKISDADIVEGARDFRLMKREMVDAILAMNEYNRFSKGIFGWVGFRTYWLPYENVERVAGTTKWSFWKLFKHAIDGIINFSQAPLSLASWGGIGMTGISFVMLIVIILRKLIFGDRSAAGRLRSALLFSSAGSSCSAWELLGSILPSSIWRPNAGPTISSARPIWTGRRKSAERKLDFHESNL